MENVLRYETIEQARNAAIRWLESHAVNFGPHRRVDLGRLGALRGREVGVSASVEPYWRIRLDFDPAKGPHFNAEVGRGHTRNKTAFCFSGTEDLVRSLANRRRPR
jgi:hypothetical protein